MPLTESWRAEGGGVDEVHRGHVESEGKTPEALEEWGRGHQLRLSVLAHQLRVPLLDLEPHALPTRGSPSWELQLVN